MLGKFLLDLFVFKCRYFHASKEWITTSTYKRRLVESTAYSPTASRRTSSPMECVPIASVDQSNFGYKEDACLFGNLPEEAPSEVISYNEEATVVYVNQLWGKSIVQ